MKIILIILTCLFSSLLADFESNSSIQLEETLQITADNMNKNLPEMVDGELRHDLIKIDGYNMILKFTFVNFLKINMSAKKVRDFIETDIEKLVCTDIDSQMILNNGMKIIYDYSDKNREHIVQFVYDKDTCKLKNDMKNTEENILHLTQKEEDINL